MSVGAHIPQPVALSPHVCGLPTLTGAQMQFLTCPRMYCLFLAGYGAGKTTVGLYWALLEAHHPANIGRTVGVLAPSYPLIQEIHIPRILAMADAVGAATGWRFLANFSKGDLSFEFSTGARIICMSYENNPRRLAGFEFAAALMDEADKELGGDYPHSIALSRLRGKGTGRLRVTTTPNGYQGVTRVYAEAMEGERPGDWGVVRAPSWSNPDITPQKLAAWRATMSAGEYAQFVEARVNRPQDLVWPEYDARRHSTEWYPVRGSEWWAAVDWGYSHAHVLCASKDGDGKKVVWGEWFEEGTNAGRVISALKAFQSTMGRQPTAIFPDRAEPESNAKLRKEFPGSRVLTKDSKDEQRVWQSVENVRRALDPAVGEHTLAFHRKIAESKRDGGVAMSLQSLRRRKDRGVPIDDIANGQPVHEHAADTLRYLNDGMDRRDSSWMVV